MQVVNLVEAPVPILGRYDDSFLELPKDVLITVCTAFYCGCLEANFSSILDSSMTKLISC
jgi:hypothetical protein